MIADRPWLFLVISVLLNAAASVLLKLSAALGGTARLLSMSGSAACYGLAFVSYFFCLRTLPVSVAYPVLTAGAILVIVLSAAVLLGESLSGTQLLGAALVIMGATLLLRQS